MKEALSQALQSGDFSGLNSLVSQTVTNTLNEVGKEVGKHIPFVESQKPDSDSQASGFVEGDYSEEDAPGDIPLWQRAKERALKEKEKQEENWQRHINRQKEQIRQRAEQLKWQAEQAKHPPNPPQQSRKALPRVQFRRVGKVSNVLYQVFGGIGMGVTGLIAFLILLAQFAGLETSVGGWLATLIFLGVFFGMIKHGIGQRVRLKRAERYIQLCGGKMYGEIEKLAKSTGRKVHFVKNDLQKMLKLGMFPEGHLDEQKTCIMLNDEVYRQYLETEENRKLLAQADEAPSCPEPLPENREDAGQPEISGEQQAELNTMVAEGMECIRKLRRLNDQIPGEIISAKLSSLEGLLREIFNSVREHPEQMHRMHKLMDYYLPTTLKLVEAYEEFDRVSAPGDDIIAAKAEIENTLDTINQAFRELLNNLFQDAVFDATTDAQVLKTMLAREGLTNDMKF